MLLLLFSVLVLRRVQTTTRNPFFSTFYPFSGKQPPKKYVSDQRAGKLTPLGTVCNNFARPHFSLVVLPAELANW